MHTFGVLGSCASPGGPVKTKQHNNNNNKIGQSRFGQVDLAKDGHDRQFTIQNTHSDLKVAFTDIREGI